MKTVLALASILSLASITAACGASMNNPDIKHNPDPKMRYDIVVTIDGAPGPFDSVEGTAFYDVSNKACVPETGGPLNPLRIAPQKNVSFSLIRINEHQYQGIIYLDLLKDEDYFGLGICHWSLTSLTTKLKVEKTTFSPGIFVGDIVSLKPRVRYYLRSDYTNASNGEEWDVSGRANKLANGPETSGYEPQDQSNIFSVTIQARESFP